MKRFYTFILCFLPAFIFGQIININNSGLNADPVNLALNVLRGGGVNVSNVTFSGNNSRQIGYYSGATSIINSSNGVIISTGNVADIATNNISSATGSIVGSASSDADIVQLAAGQTVGDCFILEFDFVPSGNEVYMKYVLASEEFTEYVCAAEADQFAVLISGPGFSGPFSSSGKQVSLVPSSTNPVSINSINNGTPGTFGTTGGCISTTNTLLYNFNIDSLMEFDGFTDVLTFTETVQCNETYHMRIILFDVGSKNFDSGIFLEEGSLSSNGLGTYDNTIYNDSIVVEGCKPYEFIIYNVAGFTSQTINLNITGSATNGLDYSPLGNSITLPDGQNFYSLLITPIADGLTEGTENVMITFDMIGTCGDTSHYQFTIYIQDENPVTAISFPNNQSICAGDVVTLNVVAQGGIPPYYIEWNGIVGNNFGVTPTVTTTYNNAVYDAAGCAYYNNFTATVYPIPIVDAGADFSICKNQQQTLGTFIDGGTNATYTWSPSSQLNANNIAYPTITATNIGSQIYTINVTNPGGCSANDAVTVTVLGLPTVNAGPDQNIIYLQTSASLLGSGTGTPMWTPFSFLNCDNCMNPTASPNYTLTYTLTITGTNGCTASDDATIFVETPTDVFVPSAFSPNGDGTNDELALRCYTISTYKFNVYDMWGKLMFETDVVDKGWDGKFNGQPASIGLYIWTADVVFVNNAGSVKLGGEVNLVR